ncbi:hypothetical protein N1851_006495 [Merluccius polli]|uniref:Uncharacterized protein n=1 Tax=Merluccius polli TaxID=89951 RepID=A0AA47N5L7_MERPO|nr:hypothetical protein N1851_006495 [Merluccius polli]
MAEVRKMKEELRRTTSSHPQSQQKTPWVEAASKSGFGSVAEILEESTIEPGPESTTISAHIEMQTYLSKPTIQRSDNPLLYWKVKINCTAVLEILI